MNLLLNYYKDKNSIKSWYDAHCSSAHEFIMYAFNGTNGRELRSFINAFNKMEEVEGIERRNWPTAKNSGQESHKQYTARALQTKLFYNDNGIFRKTSKGKSYKRFLSSKFKNNDEFLINLIYIFDGYFDNVNNYIFERSKEVKRLIEHGLNEEEISFIRKSTKKFVSNLPLIKKFSDFVNYDYFYFHSMYDDHEFIKLYVESSEDDRNELKKYILNNYNSKNYKYCCLSKKYKPGGVYTINTLKEDSLVYSISLSLNEINYVDFDSTIDRLLKVVSDYMILNTNVIKNFLNDEKDIIDTIFKNIFDYDDTESEREADEVITLEEDDLYDEIDKPETRIDDTTVEGRKLISNIFSTRKKIARLQSGYKCALEEYKNCRYFTSKQTNQNYVEVHHLIPREYSNNFGYSIDVLANYVTLCPHCHRMIHNAIDRERMDAINYIYNKRKERLNKCGLEIEIKEMYQFYKIEEKY